MIGYYADMRRVLELTEQRAARLSGWAVIVISMAVCYFGPWGIYSLRKWFTGRRSYEYLSEFFSFAVRYGWIMRIIVWAAALLLTFAVISVIPDKDAGYVTKIGSRTLQVYFWHRPLCYLFRTWKVLPNLVVLFGGRYIEEVAGQIPGLAFRGGWRPMLAGLLVYILIGAAMTALFSIKIFDHPTGDLLRLGSKLTRKKEAAS